MKKQTKEVLIIFGISILGFLASYILYTTAFWQIRDALINTFFSLRSAEVSSTGKITISEGETFVSKDIIIVGIDDKTLSKLGRYPFPRSIYREYILKPLLSTTNYYPKAIFFDIVFSEYSSPEEDKIFFEALKKSTNVFADYMFIFSEASGEGLPLSGEINSKRLKLIEKFTIPKENIKGRSKVIYASRGNLPVPEVITNSKGVGFANILTINEKSETYNSIPLVIKYEDKYYASILLLLLCQYYDVSISNVILNLGKEIIIKNAKVKYPNGIYEIRDVKIPVDKANRFLINYTSRSDKVLENGTIKTISLVDIPRIKGIERFAKDKLLLIGMLAYGYGDIWKSPISDRMYGIEHIANALNNIIMGDIYGYPGYIKILPEWIIVITSLILAILVSVVLITSKNIIVGVLEIIGLIIVTIFSSYFLFSQGTIIFGKPITNTAILAEILLPVSTILLSYIGGQIFLISKERAERLQIKGMLDSYVSPEVVNILLKNPEKLTLGGEDRDVTVFFSDIRGFTSLSEGMSPQDLVSLINRYLSIMTDIIMENRGTVDKYIGDAIMAFWGAPLDDPDHPFRACKASLEMIKALEELNKELPEGKKIDIGIGINTGIATIGNMGSTKKKNYTAMGDTVNLASRLEGVNKVFHTKIIISEYTYERIKDRILARELDLIRVKGKKIPVKIYEVIGFLDEYKPIINALGISLEELKG
ncbi:MAG: CHASE2 domain-containing protein [Brevinematia bacterium]